MISFLNCITLQSSKISVEKKDSELLTKIFYFIEHISISLSLPVLLFYSNSSNIYGTGMLQIVQTNVVVDIKFVT